MIYIKINTPLQVVSGFVVNEAIVRFDNLFVVFGTKKLFPLAYKDFDAYNKNEKPLILKADLPQLGNSFNNYCPNNNEVFEHYLSILKANEYDAEIVDTDEVEAYIVDKGLKEVDKTCGWDNESNLVDRIVSALYRIEVSIRNK